MFDDLIKNEKKEVEGNWTSCPTCSATLTSISNIISRKITFTNSTGIHFTIDAIDQSIPLTEFFDRIVRTMIDISYHQTNGKIFDQNGLKWETTFQ